MNYWLLKSEEECYSIADLKRDKVTPWSGVRNYQARNFMMREMEVGDLALFYHSSSKQAGVYGIAKIVSEAHPDETQFDPNNEHYDPKASKEKPGNTWWILMKDRARIQRLGTDFNRCLITSAARSSGR